MCCSFEPNFEPQKHKLTEKYMMTNKLYRMYLERELNRTGVFRSQHQLLMYIARYPNASQKEIALHQHVSTATIAVSLKKLEKGGYISREADRNDNRYNQICITPRGQAVVEESCKVFRRVEEAQYAGFCEAELTQFESFLDRIRLNMEYLMQEKEAPVLERQTAAASSEETQPEGSGAAPEEAL